MARQGVLRRQVWEPGRRSPGAEGGEGWEEGEKVQGPHPRALVPPGGQ